MNIKKTLFFSSFGFLVAILSLAACGPAQSENDAPSTQPDITSTPSQTMEAPTSTISPSATATVTATPEPTATLSPSDLSGNVIMLGLPENPGTYVNQGGIIHIALFEDEVDKLIENLLDLPPVDMCPEIWAETIFDEQVPTYRIYINAVEEDKDNGFYLIIRPTNPGIEPYSIVGIGLITTGSNSSFIVISQFQPPEGQPIPDELELQFVISGCEIYTTIVSWP